MELLPSQECEKILNLSVFKSARGASQFVYGMYLSPNGLRVPFKKFTSRIYETLFINLYFRECVKLYEKYTSKDLEARAFLPRFDAQLILSRITEVENWVPIQFDINNKGFILPPDFILSIQNTLDRAEIWQRL